MTPAEIAAKAAEEVFRVIERNKRINMSDITEAIAKVLATSQVTPAYISMLEKPATYTLTRAQVHAIEHPDPLKKSCKRCHGIGYDSGFGPHAYVGDCRFVGASINPDCVPLGPPARPYDVIPGDNDHWSDAAWNELVRTRLRKAEIRRQADCKKLGIAFIPSAGYASICGND